MRVTSLLIILYFYAPFSISDQDEKEEKDALIKSCVENLEQLCPKHPPEGLNRDNERACILEKLEELDEVCISIIQQGLRRGVLDRKT